MQRLVSIPLTSHVLVLPSGFTHEAAHGELRSLLVEAAEPESVWLFAEPHTNGGQVEFLSPDGRVARFDELDAVGRERLRAEIGRIVSMLRRTAESSAARDPKKFGHLPALVAGAIEIPSFEHVYAHEGRPILAAWGLAPAAVPNGLGLIRVLDDGRQTTFPVAFPLLAAALALLCLLLLGAVAAFAMPTLLGLLDPGAPVCRVAPGEREAMTGLLDEQQKEQELRRRIASLQQELGEKRAHCPIRVLPPTPTPPPPPRAETPPPPPAPPRAETPAPPPAVTSPPKPEASKVPPQKPPEPTPPPNTKPCNTETASGGAGITETRHYLGPKPGRVRLSYENYTEPDRIIVYYKGQVVGQTNNFVPGRGGFEFDWNPPPGPANNYVVTVEVTGKPGSTSTQWKYNLGCPASR